MKKTLIISLVVIILGILVFSFINRKGSIEGLIVDSNDSNSFLSAVQIIIDENKPVENNSLTGTFLLDNLKAGKHILVFKRENYREKIQEIDLKAGEKLQITVQMKARPNVVIQPKMTAVVSNTSSNNISIIDPVDKILLKEIIVGQKPIDILAIPEKGKIYTANLNDDTISVVDMKQNSEVKKIKLDDKAQPTKLAISNSKNQLYVLSRNLAQIYTINTDTDTLEKTPIKVHEYVIDFVVDKSTGNFAVLSNGYVQIMSGSSIVKAYKFKTPDFYDRIYFNGASNYAYITHSNKNFIIFVDLNNDAETTINLNHKPNVVLENPKYASVYVLSYDGLTILDSMNREVRKENLPIKGVNGINMKLSKDGDMILIVNHNTNNISIFDCKKESILPETIDVGQNPRGIDIW